MNIKTLKESYKRRVDDAEMIPLYFRFHLPGNEKTGFLIVQRLGTHGAFTEIRDLMTERFRAKYEPLLLQFGRFVPSQVLKDLLEGGIRQMSVMTYTLPPDLATRVHLKGAEKNVGTVEIRIKAKRKHTLLTGQPTWMKQLINGKASVAEMFGDETAKASIRVDYKGRQRTYDFDRRDAFAPYVDISAEVEKVNGHPKFDSIDEYCRGLRDELITQVKGEV